jgi:hypothetical protein
MGEYIPGVLSFLKLDSSKNLCNSAFCEISFIDFTFIVSFMCSYFIFNPFHLIFDTNNFKENILPNFSPVFMVSHVLP